MQPSFALDDDALRANARAFAALGAPVAAVVKCNGYRWGAARIARALEDVVESYVVSDADEFDALRPHTRRPIRLLGEVADERVAAIVARGGIPNVTGVRALGAAVAAARSAGVTPRVRIGTLDAAGWSVPPPDAFAALAEKAAREGVEVELWTHVTAPARAEAIERHLVEVGALFTARGAAVVSYDIASTASASRARTAARQRIGIGLFGAACGAPVALRCALRVEAPVVRRHQPGEVAWAGYGSAAVPPNRTITVLRCGYGDGYPKMTAGTDDILSVGMQFTTRLSDAADLAVLLIGPQTDLDRLAARAGIAPHELVVGMGHG